MAILVSKEKCTGCEVCSSACSPQALRREIAAGKLSITLGYAKCNLCGDCEKRCPEAALKITENTQDTRDKVILFECEMARCSSCGSYFAPKVLIQKFKKVLSGREPRTIASLELCPACKNLDVAQQVASL